MTYKRKGRTVRMACEYDQDGILTLVALENIYPLVYGDRVVITDEVIR